MNAGRLFPLSLRGGACVTRVGKGAVVMDQWWRGGRDDESGPAVWSLAAAGAREGDTDGWLFGERC